MDRIVHLGRGRTATSSDNCATYTDPTIERPRNRMELRNIPYEPRSLAMRCRQSALIARERKPATKVYEPGPLMELAADQCRFFIDDHLCCGKKSLDNKSWCFDHIGIVYGRAI